MAVWKRKWKTRLGEEREAWVMEYQRRRRSRHLETFAARKTPTLATPRSRST